jgi:cytochrome d ubiquinol oxidase subunit II
MDLNILWFLLIAVLYAGFFVLEGFDFGVGILLPFLGTNDKKRRLIINTIGPHWDGNEVWLLTAGGATFAAFPHWYATFFSGFYLALFLLLLALIVRGVAFEFRSKDDDPRWRAVWDWSIFVGSLLPALLLGMAFANLMRGVPIDDTMTYVGGFWNLLNPYALLGGIASVILFTLHGAIFLSLKTSGDLMESARKIANQVWLPAVIVPGAYFIWTYFTPQGYPRLGVNPGVIPIVAGAAILAAGYFLRQKKEGWAFGMTAVTIIFSVATIFLVLFPRVMVSSLDETLSLTIYNASSSPYTLRVMTIIALTVVPVVLIYQGWTYWVFRQRLTDQTKLEY